MQKGVGEGALPDRDWESLTPKQTQKDKLKAKAHRSPGVRGREGCSARAGKGPQDHTAIRRSANTAADLTLSLHGTVATIHTKRMEVCAFSRPGQNEELNLRNYLIAPKNAGKDSETERGKYEHRRQWRKETCVHDYVQ